MTSSLLGLMIALGVASAFIGLIIGRFVRWRRAARTDAEEPSADQHLETQP